jgi:eukaryotic-like serine/threonine-protein kinase
MSTVQLHINRSDGTAQTFEIKEHDTFLLGRMSDCHFCVTGDSQVSRHHFILEACPPMALLRDLGSMNGTYVNGKKSGGRAKGETPEQGALRQYPSIVLKDGDTIKVGQSTIQVRLEASPNEVLVRAALGEADISRLSPEAMRQLIFGSPHQELFSLSNYSIQRELGRGGCGAVYLATAKSGGDPVAVKLMLSRANAETRAIEQFKREMQVIAGLQHPNIVRFLDSGSDRGTFFFVMEYCDGGSLADVAKNRGGTIPLDDLMPWALQALEGLAAALSKGFVHRDIKPHNLLLQRNSAKISDFGLAKNFQKAGLSGMSITGNYGGTPVFMPPEQITNFKYVKPVSDVWSFAASLYQLLTGKFPYRFDPKRDPIDIILNENPVSIRERMPQLDKKIATVIDTALLRNPKDRYADAGKLLAALPKERS